MGWKEYWEDLIAERKLKNVIAQINEIDMDKYGKCSIEEICHNIYNDYNDYANNLENIRQELLKIIEKFPGVHLQTSRVKKLDSVLCKVIVKKHAHMLDENSPYSDITDKNYKDILTDLIGIRLIISYRGKWIDLHQSIIREFPYAEDLEMYNEYAFIPHPSNGKNILAEIPKAYHAYGDDLSMYEDVLVECKIKNNGYRSVHYVVSFMNTYIEIQTRTIYDEAWNDCDHNYVYKKEHHVSYSALKELSDILSYLTNASNDLGEKMQQIYEDDILEEKEGQYVEKAGFDLKMTDVFDKIKAAQNLLEKFNDNIVDLRGENHEE